MFSRKDAKGAKEREIPIRLTRISLANRFVAFSGKQRAGDHWLGVYDGGQGQGMTEIISVSGAEPPDHGRAQRED